MEATYAPAPVVTAPVVATSVVPSPIGVAPYEAAPQPPEPPPDRHSHREREAGYVNVTAFVDLIDPSMVRFTPDSPSSVPEIERGSHITGLAPGFDHAVGGIALGFGFRPAPWLRLPDIHLAWGAGDLSGTMVGIEGGGQSLIGEMHELWMLRAQIGGGFDFDLDPVRLYALGHVGIAGYFAQTEVSGSSIGGLGSDMYSAASLEAGWTVGMEIELDADIAYTIAYRHVHTGIEHNSISFGMNVRF